MHCADSKDDDYFEAFYSLESKHYNRRKWFQFYKYITLAAFQRCAENASEYVLLWLTKCLVNVDTHMTGKDLFFILVDSSVCFYNIVLDLRQRYAHAEITFNRILTSIGELEKIINLASVSKDEKKIFDFVLYAIKSTLYVAAGRYRTAYRYIYTFIKEYGNVKMPFEKQSIILCGWCCHTGAIVAWRANDIDNAVKFFSFSFCFLLPASAPYHVMGRYLLDLLCGKSIKAHLFLWGSCTLLNIYEF